MELTSITPILKALIESGVPGAVIAYLIWTIYRRDKRDEQRDKELADLQERRASERERNATALQAAADAMSKMSESVRDMAEAAAAQAAKSDALQEKLIYALATLDVMRKQRD